MWSDKKAVNYSINILLFLIGINICHFGQLLLPIICSILFIDNKYRLNIKNIKVFIILCLFGIAFFAFSYKSGFYSTMGFCLPMAYYIGSNLKEKNEKNIIKIVYLLSFGMATHVILNFIYELLIFGSSTFNKIHHFDIWTQDMISTTGTSINYTFLTSIVYFLIFYESNKLIKRTGLILFLLIYIYNFALGRRTPILMLIIALITSYILDILIFKRRKINKKTLKYSLIVLAIFLIMFSVFYIYDLYDFRRKFIFLNLILKFYNFGLNPERIQLFIGGIKLAPKYLWGGQYISTILETQIHDLWMDVYDYAGIIPFILLIIYTIIIIIDVYKNMNYIKEKIFFVPLLLCILLQMLLEPIITGSSIFLICTIIIISLIQTGNVSDRQTNDEQ